MKAWHGIMMDLGDHGGLKKRQLWLSWPPRCLCRVPKKRKAAEEFAKKVRSPSPGSLNVSKSIARSPRENGTIMKFYLRLSSAGVIKVIAIDVGPLENSSTGTNLSQRIIQKLQFNDCKSVFVMQLLYLGFDVLLPSGNNIENVVRTHHPWATLAQPIKIDQNHTKASSWWKTLEKQSCSSVTVSFMPRSWSMNRSK